MIDEANDFTPDELAHLSLIEDSLEGLCERRGFELIECEPTRVVGRKSWMRRVSFKINGEESSLSFISYIDSDNVITKYYVSGFGEFDDSLFRHVNEYSGDDLSRAMEHFSILLDCASNKSVPTNLLKIQNSWDNIGVPKPKGYENAIPIFTAVGIYKLERNFNHLEVRRMFWQDFSESTEIMYDGRILCESVSINKGIITEVRNWYSSRKYSRLQRGNSSPPAPNPFEDLDSYTLASRYLANLPKPKKRTYHQIKTFESKLRELPSSLQPDLEAIYRGSGIFS